MGLLRVLRQPRLQLRGALAQTKFVSGRKKGKKGGKEEGRNNVLVSYRKVSLSELSKPLQMSLFISVKWP